MSRVIKFRAWDFKEMRYDVTGLEHGVENEMAGVFLDGEYHAISNLKGDVYNKTAALMQFTGLHDANGTELYDGDIIADEEGLSKIYWHDKDFMWCASDVGGLCELAGADFKVIGNIYQNSDLLESAK